MPKADLSFLEKGVKQVKDFVRPIGTQFNHLNTARKAAVIGGGAAIGAGGLALGNALGSGQNTTINKISFDEIAELAFKDELQKIASKKYK